MGVKVNDSIGGNMKCCIFIRIGGFWLFTWVNK